MERFINGLTTLLKWIGAVSITAMMLLTCADVVMRALGRPIWGAVEIVGFLATTALACAMPYTHVMRGHAAVDMLVRRLSARTQGLVDFITALMSAILFILIAWQSVAYASAMRRAGEVSMTLEFPTYVFIYYVGLTFVVLSLTVLLDVRQALRKALRS